MPVHNLISIMKNLDKVLKQIENLTVYQYIPDSVQAVPAVIIEPLSGDYYRTFGDHDSTQINLILFVERGSPEKSQQMLIQLMEVLEQKVNANPTLGDGADFCIINGFADFGTYEYAGVKYLGVTLNLFCQE